MWHGFAGGVRVWCVLDAVLCAVVACAGWAWDDFACDGVACDDVACDGVACDDVGGM